MSPRRPLTFWPLCCPVSTLPLALPLSALSVGATLSCRDGLNGKPPKTPSLPPRPLNLLNTRIMAWHGMAWYGRSRCVRVKPQLQNAARSFALCPHLTPLVAFPAIQTQGECELKAYVSTSMLDAQHSPSLEQPSTSIFSPEAMTSAACARVNPLQSHSRPERQRPEEKSQRLVVTIDLDE